MFDKYRTNSFIYYNTIENKNDLIRGIFDGDGSICHRYENKNKGRMNITVPVIKKDIKLIIDDYFKNNNIKYSTYLDKRGAGCWCISVNRQEGLNKFFNLIYSNNPELYLKRKYDKFVYFLYNNET